MVVIIDADYHENTGRGHVAGVLAGSILDDKETGVITALVDEIEAYIPGQFYRRELKCVDAILSKLQLEDVSLILIDGYADSGTPEKSLGTHVFEKYGIPVIGVAKNRYKKCQIPNTEVLRGSSQKSLYVTSKGIDNEIAKDWITHMAGENRIPYLIKLADTYARHWT